MSQMKYWQCQRQNVQSVYTYVAVMHVKVDERVKRILRTLLYFDLVKVNLVESFTNRINLKTYPMRSNVVRYLNLTTYESVMLTCHLHMDVDVQLPLQILPAFTRPD
jgi:hypothetical protein